MADDLIYRQAAIDTIGNVPDYDDGMVWEALSHAQRDVALLPSAEPKTGKWIVDEKRFGHIDRHCSLCGAILEGDDWKWRNNYYCYHCGAPMDLKGD